MSDALTEALAAEEARYRDPVVKSEVITPAVVGAGGEPIAAPTDTVTETTVEDGKPIETKVEEPKASEPEKKERRESGEQVAIRRLTAKLGDAGRREQELMARLQALESASKQPPNGEQPQFTQADVDRLAKELAKEGAKQLFAEEKKNNEIAAFNAACDRVAAAGEQEYGAEFTDTVGVLWKVIDPQASTTLVEAALETENPQAVLFHLGKNVAEAERIAGMKPAKLGAAIAKIANSLAKPADPPALRPQISRAPAPLEPIAGTARPAAGELGPKNMDDWIKWDAERSKRK